MLDTACRLSGNCLSSPAHYLQLPDLIIKTLPDQGEKKQGAGACPITSVLGAGGVLVEPNSSRARDFEMTIIK